MRIAAFILRKLSALIFSALLLDVSASASGGIDEVAGKLYKPDGGRLLVEGRQVRGDVPVLSCFEDNIPIGDAEEQYSAIVSFGHGAFSLVFRPDSTASFSSQDVYWDGKQCAAYSRDGKVLTLYEDGVYLDATYRQLSYFIDYGVSGLERLVKAARDGGEVKLSYNNEGDVELSMSYGGQGFAGVKSAKAYLYAVDNKYVLRELEVMDAVGCLQKWVNTFSRRPKTLSEAFTFHLNTVLASRGMLKPDTSIIQMYDFTALSSGLPDDFAFKPDFDGLLNIVDQRLGGKPVQYASDKGPVTLDELKAFKANPSLIFEYEKGAQSRAKGN